MVIGTASQGLCRRWPEIPEDALTEVNDAERSGTRYDPGKSVQHRHREHVEYSADSRNRGDVMREPVHEFFAAGNAVHENAATDHEHRSRSRDREGFHEVGRDPENRA